MFVKYRYVIKKSNKIRPTLLYLSGVLLGVNLRIDTIKSRVGQSLTTSSKFLYHSRHNSKSKPEVLYDHLIIQKIFTLTMSRIFIQTLEFARKVAMGMIW